MDKKGNIILYAIFSFIALILFVLLLYIVPDIYNEGRLEIDHSSSDSFIATVTANETLSPVGEGITSITVARKNSTWLSFDGINDYLFIPDYNYTSVALWVNNSDTNWILIVNSSDSLYQNNGTVSNFSLNPFKKNATGWYFGINDSGFFEGDIDTIKFYNDTMNETQISELYANGR